MAQNPAPLMNREIAWNSRDVWMFITPNVGPAGFNPDLEKILPGRRKQHNTFPPKKRPDLVLDLFILGSTMWAASFILGE
jgi:hypothetical protein